MCTQSLSQQTNTNLGPPVSHAQNHAPVQPGFYPRGLLWRCVIYLHLHMAHSHPPRWLEPQLPARALLLGQEQTLLSAEITRRLRFLKNLPLSPEITSHSAPRHGRRCDSTQFSTSCSHDARETKQRHQYGSKRFTFSLVYSTSRGSSSSSRHDLTQCVVGALAPTFAVPPPDACQRQETGLTPLARTCTKTWTFLGRPASKRPDCSRPQTWVQKLTIMFHKALLFSVRAEMRAKHPAGRSMTETPENLSCKRAVT